MVGMGQETVAATEEASGVLVALAVGRLGESAEEAVKAVGAVGAVKAEWAEASAAVQRAAWAELAETVGGEGAVVEAQAAEATAEGTARST